MAASGKMPPPRKSSSSLVNVVASSSAARMKIPNFHLRRIGPSATKPGVANVMDFDKVTTLIGRNRGQVDYVLDSSDPVASQYISRLHARVIRQEQSAHRLYDDSLNGIFINNTKICGSVILQEGDVVTFGHPHGVKLSPGMWKRQPDSEYQFIFEKCSCQHQQTKTRKRPNVLEDKVNISLPDYKPRECDTVTKKAKTDVHDTDAVLSATKLLDSCITRISGLAESLNGSVNCSRHDVSISTEETSTEEVGKDDVDQKPSPDFTQIKQLPSQESATTATSTQVMGAPSMTVQSTSTALHVKTDADPQDSSRDESSMEKAQRRITEFFVHPCNKSVNSSGYGGSFCNETFAADDSVREPLEQDPGRKADMGGHETSREGTSGGNGNENSPTKHTEKTSNVDKSVTAVVESFSLPLSTSADKDSVAEQNIQLSLAQVTTQDENERSKQLSDSEILNLADKHSTCHELTKSSAPNPTGVVSMPETSVDTMTQESKENQQLGSISHSSTPNFPECGDNNEKSNILQVSSFSTTEEKAISNKPALEQPHHSSSPSSEDSCAPIPKLSSEHVIIHTTPENCEDVDMIGTATVLHLPELETKVMKEACMIASEKEGTDLPIANQEENNVASALSQEENNVAPIVSEENNVAPIVSEENNDASTVSQEENNVAPTIVQEENNVAPTVVQEENNVAPTVVHKENNVASTVVQEESNVAPSVSQEESSVASTVVQEENNVAPSVSQEESSVASTVVQEESNVAPSVSQEENNVASTVVQEESNVAPSVSQEESSVASTVVQEESNVAPSVSQEESSVASTVVQEENNVASTVVQEENNVAFTVVPEESNVAPTVSQEESNVAPTVSQEESNIAPTVSQEESNVAPTVSQEESSIAPTVSQEENNVAPTVSQEESNVAPTVSQEENNVAPTVSQEENNVAPTVSQEENNEPLENEEENNEPLENQEKSVTTKSLEENLAPTESQEESNIVPIVNHKENTVPITKQGVTYEPIANEGQNDFMPTKNRDEDKVITTGNEEENNAALTIRKAENNVVLLANQGENIVSYTNEGENNETIANQKDNNVVTIKEQEGIIAPTISQEENNTAASLSQEESNVASALSQEESNVAPTVSQEESNVASALSQEESNVAPTVSQEESNVASALSQEESNIASALSQEESNVASALRQEESNVASALSQEEINVASAVSQEESNVAPTVSQEESKVAPTVSQEESNVASALSQEENNVASALSQEESNIASALSQEESNVASALSQEESNVASAVSQEESNVAPTVNQEESNVAPTVSQEESNVASAVSQESNVASALSQEENNVASVSSQENNVASAVSQEESNVALTVSQEENNVASSGSQEENVASAVGQEENNVAPTGSQEESSVAFIPSREENNFTSIPGEEENKLVPTANVGENTFLPITNSENAHSSAQSDEAPHQSSTAANFSVIPQTSYSPHLCTADSQKPATSKLPSPNITAEVVRAVCEDFETGESQDEFIIGDGLQEVLKKFTADSQQDENDVGMSQRTAASDVSHTEKFEEMVEESGDLQDGKETVDSDMLHRNSNETGAKSEVCCDTPQESEKVGVAGDDVCSNVSHMDTLEKGEESEACSERIERSYREDDIIQETSDILQGKSDESDAASAKENSVSKEVGSNTVLDNNADTKMSAKRSEQMSQKTEPEGELTPISGSQSMPSSSKVVALQNPDKSETILLHSSSSSNSHTDFDGMDEVLKDRQDFEEMQELVKKNYLTDDTDISSQNSEQTQEYLNNQERKTDYTEHARNDGLNDDKEERWNDDERAFEEMQQLVRSNYLTNYSTSYHNTAHDPANRPISADEEETRVFEDMQELVQRNYSISHDEILEINGMKHDVNGIPENNSILKETTASSKEKDSEMKLTLHKSDGQEKAAIDDGTPVTRMDNITVTNCSNINKVCDSDHVSTTVCEDDRLLNTLTDEPTTMLSTGDKTDQSNDTSHAETVCESTGHPNVDSSVTPSSSETTCEIDSITNAETETADQHMLHTTSDQSVTTTDSETTLQIICGTNDETATGETNLQNSQDNTVSLSTNLPDSQDKGSNSTQFTTSTPTSENTSDLVSVSDDINSISPVAIPVDASIRGNLTQVTEKGDGNRTKMFSINDEDELQSTIVHSKTTYAEGEDFIVSTATPASDKTLCLPESSEKSCQGKEVELTLVVNSDDDKTTAEKDIASTNDEAITDHEEKDIVEVKQDQIVTLMEEEENLDRITGEQFRGQETNARQPDTDDFKSLRESKKDLDTSSADFSQTVDKDRQRPVCQTDEDDKGSEDNETPVKLDDQGDLQGMGCKREEEEAHSQNVGNEKDDECERKPGVDVAVETPDMECTADKPKTQTVNTECMTDDPETHDVYISSTPDLFSQDVSQHSSQRHAETGSENESTQERLHLTETSRQTSVEHTVTEDSSQEYENKNTGYDITSHSTHSDVDNTENGDSNNLVTRVQLKQETESGKTTTVPDLYSKPTSHHNSDIHEQEEENSSRGEEKLDNEIFKSPSLPESLTSNKSQRNENLQKSEELSSEKTECSVKIPNDKEMTKDDNEIAASADSLNDDNQSFASEISDFRGEDDLCLVWSQTDTSTDKTSSLEDDTDDVSPSQPFSTPKYPVENGNMKLGGANRNVTPDFLQARYEQDKENVSESKLGDCKEKDGCVKENEIQEERTKSDTVESHENEISAKDPCGYDPKVRAVAQQVEEKGTLEENNGQTSQQRHTGGGGRSENHLTEITNTPEFVHRHGSDSQETVEAKLAVEDAMSVCTDEDKCLISDDKHVNRLPQEISNQEKCAGVGHTPGLFVCSTEENVENQENDHAFGKKARETGMKRKSEEFLYSQEKRLKCDQADVVSEDSRDIPETQKDDDPVAVISEDSHATEEGGLKDDHRGVNSRDSFVNVREENLVECNSTLDPPEDHSQNQERADINTVQVDGLEMATAISDVTTKVWDENKDGGNDTTLNSQATEQSFGNLSLEVMVSDTSLINTVKNLSDLSHNDVDVNVSGTASDSLCLTEPDRGSSHDSNTESKREEVDENLDDGRICGEQERTEKFFPSHLSSETSRDKEESANVQAFDNSDEASNIHKAATGNIFEPTLVSTPLSCLPEDKLAFSFDTCHSDTDTSQRSNEDNLNDKQSSSRTFEFDNSEMSETCDNEMKGQDSEPQAPEISSKPPASPTTKEMCGVSGKRKRHASQSSVEESVSSPPSEKLKRRKPDTDASRVCHSDEYVNVATDNLELSVSSGDQKQKIHGNLLVEQSLDAGTTHLASMDGGTDKLDSQTPSCKILEDLPHTSVCDTVTDTITNSTVKVLHLKHNPSVIERDFDQGTDVSSSRHEKDDTSKNSDNKLYDVNLSPSSSVVSQEVEGLCVVTDVDKETPQNKFTIPKLKPVEKILAHDRDKHQLSACVKVLHPRSIFSVSADSACEDAEVELRQHFKPEENPIPHPSEKVSTTVSDNLASSKSSEVPSNTSKVLHLLKGVATETKDQQSEQNIADSFENQEMGTSNGKKKREQLTGTNAAEMISGVAATPSPRTKVLHLLTPPKCYHMNSNTSSSALNYSNAGSEERDLHSTPHSVHSGPESASCALDKQSSLSAQNNPSSTTNTMQSISPDVFDNPIPLTTKSSQNQSNISFVQNTDDINDILSQSQSSVPTTAALSPSCSSMNSSLTSSPSSSGRFTSSQSSSQHSPDGETPQNKRAKRREKLQSVVLSELQRLHKEIRSCLKVGKPNISQAVAALEDLDMLPINCQVLSTFPAVLETVRKCQKYAFSEEVRTLSAKIYTRFQALMPDAPQK